MVSRTATGPRKTVDVSAFSALSPDGNGSAADRALFERMTNEQLAPGPNDFLTRQRVHLIGAVRWLYRLLAVAGIVIAGIRLYAAVRDRRPQGWTTGTLLSVSLLLVLVRIVGLAYLDLTAFPAFSETHLAPAYAVTLVLGVTVAVSERPSPRSARSSLGRSDVSR